jgi:hypothetical protein
MIKIYEQTSVSIRRGAGGIRSVDGFLRIGFWSIMDVSGRTRTKSRTQCRSTDSSSNRFCIGSRPSCRSRHMMISTGIGQQSSPGT